MGGDLGCNNIIQKHLEQVDCKTTYMTRLKGSERTPFIFIFRFNIVLQDSYHVDEIVIENKAKDPGNYVNSLSRVLLSMLETSIVS